MPALSLAQVEAESGSYGFIQTLFIVSIFCLALYFVVKKMRDNYKDDVVNSSDDFERVRSDGSFVVNLDGDYVKSY